jgi:hypothetical protein
VHDDQVTNGLSMVIHCLEGSTSLKNDVPSRLIIMRKPFLISAETQLVSLLPKEEEFLCHGFTIAAEF